MPYLAKFAAALAAAAVVAGAAAAHQLTLEVNKTKPLTLRGEIVSVVIGNPAVADVAVSDSNTLFVTGKTFGTTNLIVYNADGRQIYAADVAVTARGGGLVSVARGGAVEIMDCSPSCAATIGQ